jgi:hypothetical protein
MTKKIKDIKIMKDVNLTPNQASMNKIERSFGRSKDKSKLNIGQSGNEFVEVT